MVLLNGSSYFCSGPIAGALRDIDGGKDISYGPGSRGGSGAAKRDGGEKVLQ